METDHREELRRFIEVEIQRIVRQQSDASPFPAKINVSPMESDAQLRLDALHSALDRVMQGTNGVCVFCGSQIPSNQITPSGHWQLCARCAPYYARDI
jgi:RNA polymerase-binding transcription factor DksA